jgi:hypothetical protein
MNDIKGVLRAFCLVTLSALLPACGSGGGDPPTDTTAPGMPVLTGTLPSSPSQALTPAIRGTAEAGSTVRLYADPAGAETLRGSGTADETGAFSIGVTVAPNAATTFYATATDVAGNVSPMTALGITYLNDTLAPASPSLISTVPASPSKSLSCSVRA